MENIWEEPSSDKGRLLYTDTGTIRCATLNKLLIHLTGALGLFLVNFLCGVFVYTHIF